MSRSPSVCMYVCVMCLCPYRAYIHIHTHAGKYTSTHIQYVHRHIHTHTCTHSTPHTHTYTHIHAQTHTYTYTHTHTHTPTRPNILQPRIIEAKKSIEGSGETASKSRQNQDTRRKCLRCVIMLDMIRTTMIRSPDAAAGLRGGTASA